MSQIVPEIRHTLRLAGPIALSQLAQITMGFVDTVMVGRLGPTPLAAIALGAALLYPLLMLFFGSVLAVGPLVAQAYGGRKARGVAESTRQGLWTALWMSALCILSLRLAGHLLFWMGQPEDVALITQQYLNAVSWGIPGFLAFGALRSFAEAVGKPLPVTVIALLAVGVNVFSNDALIFGRYGLPAFGAVGAGYATAISYTFMALLLSLYVSMRAPFRKYGVLRSIGWPQRKRQLEIVRLGVPIGFSFAIEASLFTVTALLMGLLGTEALAAHQIALQCASITFMVPLSVGLAGSVRVGQAVGGGRQAQARLAGFVAIGLSALFMLFTAFVFVTFPNALIAVYIDVQDPVNANVVLLAAQLLAIAGVFQVFDGIQVSCAGALRGLKDTRIPMLIGLATYWGIGLSAGVFLSFTLGFGPHGLWWGLVSGLAAAAFGLSLRFHLKTRIVPPYLR